MKLAEALQERADLNRRLEQLRSRLLLNALVQEGERPAEDPMELMDELETVSGRLEELMVRINVANTVTKVDGLTLTELIARKDCLKGKISVCRSFLAEAGATARRASRTEIKVLSTVNVKDLQKKVDALSKELREVDNKLQSANWTTEL